MTEGFSITYEFTLPNEEKEIFHLLFNDQALLLESGTLLIKPFWTRLDVEQCPHCPLTPQSHPHCPVALNLVPAIQSFDHLMSFDKIVVKVMSLERHTVQQTSAQEGISSLMGLLIAGSSCPLTHFFKPMARFHLPFANCDETMWRAASTFLLAQYFTHQGLEREDIELTGLSDIYASVAKLNDAVVQRLRIATSKDSAVNALVHLDVFAKFLVPPLENSLSKLKPIFETFITRLK